MPATATRKPAAKPQPRTTRKAQPAKQAAKKATAKAAPTKPQPKAQPEAKPATEAKWDAKTLKRVVALRDDELSWAKIAKELNLGSPGTARRAWREATGHTGTLPRLAGKGGRVTAEADE